MMTSEQLQQLNVYLNVRFTKVMFVVRFTEDTELVANKASALRGGMGEMLLNANCVINGRKCESCGFASECLIQRMLYSRLENRPAFMHTGDSVGYMVYCDNKERNFRAGDQMEFSLTLFGSNIIYFTQYLNAFYALGQHGLGTGKSHFRIMEVKNMYGQDILDGNNIYMARYKWQTLREYVDYRMEKMQSGRGSYLLKFCSMTDIKFQGKFVEAFTEEILKASILRRLYILSCFENLPVDGPYEVQSDFPEILAEKTKYEETYRHSNRKNQTMKLHGITGNVWIEPPTEEWLRLLLAAEVTHIGKCTSFGLGKLRVCAERREGGSEKS